MTRHQPRAEKPSARREVTPEPWLPSEGPRASVPPYWNSAMGTWVPGLGSPGGEQTGRPQSLRGSAGTGHIAPRMDVKWERDSELAHMSRDAGGSLGPAYCHRSWAWRSWSASLHSPRCCTPSSAAHTTWPPVGRIGCRTWRGRFAGPWSRPWSRRVYTRVWRRWWGSRRHSSRWGWAARAWYWC